jgi:hypothetical protein
MLPLVTLLLAYVLTKFSVDNTLPSRAYDHVV